jgi:hypothetical protein
MDEIISGPVIRRLKSLPPQDSAGLILVKKENSEKAVVEESRLNKLPAETKKILAPSSRKRPHQVSIFQNSLAIAACLNNLA